MTSTLWVLAVCFPLLAGVSAGFAPYADRTQTFSRTLVTREINPRFRRDAGVRSSSFTPSEVTLSAEELPKLEDNTHEITFLDDDGSSFILTWVGDGTGVILVLSTYNLPEGWYLGVSSSRLYRSEDSGKNFHDISHVINNTYIRKEFGIIVGPGNSGRVILTADGEGVKSGVIFTSRDSGKTFTRIDLPFYPFKPITYHLSNPDYLLVSSIDKCLWLSKDFGNTWIKVHDNIQTYTWGQGDTLFFSTSLKITVDADRRGELLLMRTEDLGNTFTTVASKIFSFGYLGGFLFTSVVKNAGDPRVIYISTDQGDSFNQAQLPSATMEQFYSVLEADNEMIFMHVDEPGDTNFGTVYTSDAQGILFSKSLEHHLFTMLGKSDFTNITSLRGVYLTNVITEDGYIQSVISYDSGGEWISLNKPENEECDTSAQNCNLHIHGEYSVFNNKAPMTPLSDPSAVGIIIAHGSVGDSLTRPDVFVSDDGGYSWNKTLKGPHHYALLDSGGIIVAVEYYPEKPIKTMKFSTDEGQSWKSYNFTDLPIIFVGLASEPGTKTMNISIWGYRPEDEYKATWVSVTIDFEALLNRDCEEKDYVEWVAHSTTEQNKGNEGCVLGYKEKFRRLRKLSVCRNGRDYIIIREQSPCLCTKEDYMCDYGYYRHENSSECVKQADFKDQDLELCLNGEEEVLQTTGYRKVPGDKCEGGFTPKRTEKDIHKLCGQQSQSQERTAVTAVSICVLVLALSVGVFLIVRKYVCGGRMIAYRFSALQLQDDDLCIAGESEQSAVINEGGFHDDSDEDLIA